jgi:Mce-associated membrane protein
MPSGKKARGIKAEPDEPQAAPEADEAAVEEPAAVVEQPAAPVEEPAAPVEAPASSVEAPTAAVEEPAVAEELPTAPVDEPPVKQGRRRNFLRRRKNQPEVAATDTAETEEATAEEPAAAEPVDDKTAVDDETTIDDEVTTDAPAVADAPAEEAAQETEEVQEPEPVLVPHRPAGKRLKIVAAAAAVLFVAGGAFLGWAAQPVIANRALVDTKLDVARTAANAITTLWSYTPENMDSLADRSARYLTGDFAFQYRKFIDSIVATNKQAQITNTTSVLGSAVEAVGPSDASAVVYTNSIATSPVSKNIPSLRYLSYRLEMKRDHSEWRITRMTTITSLDLTPQL